jgi:hypothetical protein
MGALDGGAVGGVNGRGRSGAERPRPAGGGAAAVEVGADRRRSDQGGSGPILGLLLEMEFLRQGGCEAMDPSCDLGLLFGCSPLEIA